jgi:hypothetical protein
VHEKLVIDADLGFVKTLVPPSDLAPHMALLAGKHYYKRSGDSFYQCEHFDIIDMLSRKKSPQLQLTTRILKRSLVSEFKYRYEIIVSVINTGKTIAKHPYLAMNCNHQYKPCVYGLDGNRNTGLAKVPNNISYRYNYSGGYQTVIYPETMLDVDKYITEIDSSAEPKNFSINYLLAAENMENIKGDIIVQTTELLIQGV